MLPEAIPIAEIERLYSEEQRTVAEVAAYFGVTRQGIYYRLRKGGIEIRRRPHGTAAKRAFDPETLRKLYEDEGLTLDQIAERLNSNPSRVSDAMTAHNINRRSPGEYRRKYPPLSGLRIGDSLTILFDTPQMPTFSFLLREAKRLGLRIVIRRLNGSTAVIIRTQLLLPETVATMFRSGMTRSAIAKKFYCSAKTISKILREMGISKRER